MCRVGGLARQGTAPCSTVVREHAGLALLILKVFAKAGANAGMLVDVEKGEKQISLCLNIPMLEVRVQDFLAKRKTIKDLRNTAATFQTHSDRSCSKGVCSTY